MEFALPKVNTVVEQTKIEDPRDTRPVSADELRWRAIVQPDKVLPVPKYLLRYWYGRLSAGQLMMVLGARQAAFLPKNAAEVYVRRRLSLAQIGRWSGLSRQRVSRVLLESSPDLARFLRRDGSQGEGEDADLLLRVRIPLAPEHLRALEALAQDEYVPWRAENPRGVVKDFIAHLAETAPEVSALDPLARVLGETAGQAFESLAGILDQYFPAMSPEDHYWCLKYEDQLVQPGRNMVFSHYFLNNWLPELTSLEALTILMLRLYCQTGEPEGKTAIGGIAQAAALLRVDRKTARKIIQQIAAGEGPLVDFAQAVYPWPDAGPFLLRVALWDPLHPRHRQDQPAAFALEETGWTGARRQRLFSPHRAASPVDGTACSAGGEKVDMHPGKGLQTEIPPEKTVDGWQGKCCQDAGNRLTAGGENIDRLIKDESGFIESGLLNPEQPQRIEPEIQESAEAVVSGWPIELVFESAGLKDHPKTARLLSQIAERPALVDQVVARLIWAYERGVDENGRGIRSPELYVLQHYHEKPPVVYLRLARRGPEDLLDACLGSYWHNLPEDQHKILMTAKKRGFGALMDSLFPETDPDEDQED